LAITSYLNGATQCELDNILPLNYN